MAKKRAKQPASRQSEPDEVQTQPLTGQSAIRDRIKEFRRVKAADLLANPKNWRTHPTDQREALKGVLNEVGYCDALLARELPDGSLLLIDGHMRAETTPDMEVPVLILDVDEAEANKLLATLDPITLMAEMDGQAFSDLLMEVESIDGAVNQMWSGMASSSTDEFVAEQERAKQNEKYDAALPQYPLAPMPGEQYNYVMIFCTTEMDMNALSQLLGIVKRKSYKSRSIGTGRVITFQDFWAKWSKREAAVAE